jgi:hypothetical protein
MFCVFNTVPYLCTIKNSKAMTNLKTTLGLRNNIDQFSTLEGAKRWANNCIKLHTVMLGCNGKYWVVCFADAQKLHKMGYEIAA